MGILLVVSRRGNDNHAAMVALVCALAVAVVVGVIYGLSRYDREVDDATDDHAAQQRAFDRAVAQREAEQAAAEKAAVTLTVKRPADRPLRVLFVGDSLTAGYFATTEEKSFVSRVVEAIGGDVEVLEGQQIANGAGKTGHIERVDSGADLAVIELGTDDVVDQNLNRFEDDYTDLLDMVQEGSPDAQLLCLGVWHINAGGYDDIIDDLCRARGGVFEDLSDIYTDPSVHGPEGRETWRGTGDEFHPNDRGHALIAQTVMYHLDVR